MKKIINYIKATVVCLIIIFATSITTYSYPAKPTMMETWGFQKDDKDYKVPMQVPTYYEKKGKVDWSQAMEHARKQFSASPAKVSIKLTSVNPRIKCTSDSYPSVTWSGRIANYTTQFRDYSIAMYMVDFNDYSVSSAYMKKTATHEIGHAFGLYDCSTTGYIMYGWQNTHNTITNYENNLYINRYGKF